MTPEQLITEHLRWMRSANLARNTIKDRARILARLEAELPEGILHPAPEELTAWLAQPGWTRKTRATYRTHITSFYAWTAAAGKMTFDPAARLPRTPYPQGKPKPVSDAELAKILSEANPDVRLWALLAAYAGLRCCEIARLDRDDVTEAGIWVRGKGDRERFVPRTHPKILAAVEGLPPGPLARRQTGERASAEYVSGAFRKHVHHGLRLPRVSLHRLRHWCATNALRACRNVRTVQQLLGHASVANTAIYTEILADEVADAVAALPDI